MKIKNRFLSSKKILLTGIASGITIYLFFILSAGKWLVKDDGSVNADVMVMLTGSLSDRILHISDLYISGNANRVIFVESGLNHYQELTERGVKMTSSSDLIFFALQDLGVAEKDITILNGNAQSTFEEAYAVRDYLLLNPDIDSIIIVSSLHHTKRASLIFNRILGDIRPPVQILYSPSPYSDFQPNRWWLTREDIQKVILEYMKIADYLLIERWKT